MGHLKIHIRHALIKVKDNTDANTASSSGKHPEYIQEGTRETIYLLPIITYNMDLCIKHL